VRTRYNKGMEKFVLHQKTYDFTLWLYPLINRLPKNHRLILGRKLEELTLSLYGRFFDNPSR